PTTEIYVNGIEIWNIVFNEFYQSKDKTLKPLEVKGIDTGMGLERLAMVSQNVPTVFDTDLFPSHPQTREERIVADHSRAIKALVEEGLKPSNKDQGYVLRRLMRRVIMLGGSVDSPVFEEEKKKFDEALEKGMKEIEKGADPFILFTSYGLPLEVIEKYTTIDKEKFERQMKEHQDRSRAGAEQKFKGGLAGHSEMEVKYHTATHLLHQALHDVLGEEVGQKGSNITPERLRFDFSFPRKLTDEEKQKVEDIVNEKIATALPVQHRVLNKEEALKTGAYHSFDEKYPDQIQVYYIGDYSKEFCGGPHVENTSALGKFKIAKEEAVGVGVRRIKAVLE
ncbi:alanine--tRNA ligase, partial [Candidatus Parcubacteria bacterium]|nr:alanine--tRNA ligase [Candidatus Parcubacteria bacterium]